MPLSVGARVGRYEILSAIGAGGMGEVYKARDSRLDRVVAVKILPERLASDPEFRERFEREARAISRLTHANICTLHDVGEEGGLSYLVMEYLEGETLGGRLAKGPLALDDTLAIGCQIAAALDCAHRAGIVHRDLKPGNIFLLRAGAAPSAKLLDFGLAKTGVAPIFAAATGVTTPPDITSAGTILGTVQYMTPEQLEGRPADTRTDVFAFGAVLYEMLSGRKAFAADSHAGLVAAILERQPELAADVPLRVRRIVDTCLAKNPDDRWQSARDLLRELTWARNPADAAPAATRVASAPPATSSRAWWFAAAAATSAVAFAAGRLLSPATTPSPSGIKFQLDTPFTNEPMSFALSPNGKVITFAAMADGALKLFVQPLDSLTPKALAGTDGAIFPFWSPDSRTIGFFAGGKLKIIDADGGSLRVLADAANGRGGTWNSDGTIVFAPTTASGIMRISPNGGGTAAITHLGEGEASHRWPEFLPDGRRFLFHKVQGTKATAGLFIGAIDGREPIRVMEGEVPSTFVSPDTLLLERTDGVLAVHFDPDKPVLSLASGVTVADPVGFDATWAKAAMSTSSAGVIAYRSSLAVPRRLVWLDRTGAERGILVDVDASAPASPEISPDGRHAVVDRIVASNTDVWLFDLARGVPSRFTFDEAVDFFGAWASDSRLIFASNRSGAFTFYEKDLGGAGEQPVATPVASAKLPMSISRDGRFLLYAVQVPQTGVDLWAMELFGDRKTIPIGPSPFDEMSGQFSPDGKWVAYQSNESGNVEVYIRPFPAAGAAIRVSSAGGTQPRWSTDGKELFFVAADSRMMAVPIAEPSGGSSIDLGTPKALFTVHLATGLNIYPAVGTKQQYAVAPDGRFLVNLPVEGARIPPITIAVGWGSAAKPR